MILPPKKNLDPYRKATDLFKALAHPIRVRLIHRLMAGECCVSGIQNCLGISQPNVSQHLKILKDARLIAGTRKGTKICYALADERVRQALALILDGE